MCVFSGKISTEDRDGTVVSAEGEYRLVGDDWAGNTFSISNLSDFNTPDIKVVGTYEMRFRVIDNDGQSSAWFYSPTTLKVTNCK